MRKARFTTALLAAGVTLLAAEGLCAWFHDRAFPFLNVFAEHPRYGVVLAANADTRVRTRRGRTTSIRTNALGFRGPEVSGGRAEVLLLGDSQVLGFGVEEPETMAGRLRARGFGVQAIAVPSWGPNELALAAEEWVPRLQPRSVVFVANVANDWPEANVPNVERSTARDGWLSRRRRDQPRGFAADFPGRAWFFGRSQLVFTLRALSALSSPRVQIEATLGAPAALRMLENVRELSSPRGAARSRITPFVRRVEAACASRCEVFVLILPMDVQVDPSEWAKYRESARDLSPLNRLGEDLIADLEGTAAHAIDLGPVLRAASPGAFLDDDPHLSAKGHAAIAHRLASQLGGAP